MKWWGCFNFKVEYSTKENKGIGTKAAHCIYYIGEGTIIKDIKFET